MCVTWRRALAALLWAIALAALGYGLWRYRKLLAPAAGIPNAEVV